ncbi:MAG TPA: TRAP transporter small permease subunit [Burkholderiales bacterium]|nr:TRAP transporter small permease subunit [Burkholderiales bacterium]
MKNKLIKTADGIDRFIDWTGLFAAWLCLVLVLLIAVEVILRYTMSLGAVWAQELEWHLLAVIALWGISYTQKEDAHVRVDILYQNFSQRTKDWLEFFSTLLVMVPLSFYVAWLAWDFMAQAYRIGEISPDPGGLTHRWVLKSFVMTGFILLGIQSTALMLRSAARVFFNNNNDNGGEHAA